MKDIEQDLKQEEITEVSRLRNDIKSYGKLAIFSKLMIEGEWVKRANFEKIETEGKGY